MELLPQEAPAGSRRAVESQRRTCWRGAGGRDRAGAGGLRLLCIINNSDIKEEIPGLGVGPFPAS